MVASRLGLLRCGSKTISVNLRRVLIFPGKVANFLCCQWGNGLRKSLGYLHRRLQRSLVEVITNLAAGIHPSRHIAVQVGDSFIRSLARRRALSRITGDDDCAAADAAAGRAGGIFAEGNDSW
ncbi:hypothetical protein D3C81_972820 [compost metagenome]